MSEQTHNHPNTLKKFEIFKSLSEKELKDLSPFVECRLFLKNEKIYEQGDELKCLYLISSGSVKLGMVSEGDRLLIKNVLYEQEIFGENIFITGTRSEFAEAHKDSLILQIPVSKIRELVMTSPSVGGFLTKMMIERIKGLNDRMESFVFKKAKERITGFIKLNGLKNGIKIGLDEFLVNHGMSHKEIAYLTDTSRQTVARVLSELKNDNIIHFSSRKPNKILIRNIAAL